MSVNAWMCLSSNSDAVHRPDVIVGPMPRSTWSCYKYSNLSNIISRLQMAASNKYGIILNKESCPNLFPNNISIIHLFKIISLRKYNELWSESEAPLSFSMAIISCHISCADGNNLSFEAAISWPAAAQRVAYRAISQYLALHLAGI